jgi:hypothetical protein
MGVGFVRDIAPWNVAVVLPVRIFALHRVRVKDYEIELPWSYVEPSRQLWSASLGDAANVLPRPEPISQQRRKVSVEGNGDAFAQP